MHLFTQHLVPNHELRAKKIKSDETILIKNTHEFNCAIVFICLNFWHLFRLYHNEKIA